MADSELSGGVQPGDVLAGKYRVERVLGRGGMGIVVAAHHLQLDERVALKFLLPEALAVPDVVARFDREARAAVKIKSEHVARVIDVGRMENGAPYMVMEYLDGLDLSVWLKERGTMPAEQIAEFVIQACEAIAEAHALGIVHRDLKPANLFCVRRADGLQSVKVLDFGISKVGAAGSSEMGMTRTNAIFGSPLYMSPEQMQSSRSVDARADIWSLGTIIFQLATGHPPFEAETMPELVLKIVGTEPPAMRSTRPEIPAALDVIVRRCLEKNRDARYQNVADLAVALGDLAPPRARASVERVVRVIQTAGLASAIAAGRTEQILERRSMPEPSSKALAAGTDAAWGQTAPGASSRGSRVVAIVALALVGLAVVAAIGIFGARRFLHPSAASPSNSVAAAASQQAPPTAMSAATPMDTGPALPVAVAAASAGAVTTDAGVSNVMSPPSGNAPKVATTPRGFAPAAPSNKPAEAPVSVPATRPPATPTTKAHDYGQM